MKTIHDLMLKDTNHEEILHDGVVESPVDAIGFLNALDFVVKEWNEAMDSFDIDGQEDVATDNIRRFDEYKTSVC